MEKRGVKKFLLTVLVTFCLMITQLSTPALAAQDPGVTLPDDKVGYQIQLVYVETSSAVGSKYDTNGQIASWVAQLQSWLKMQTGKELIFDTHKGNLDIAYLKFDGNFTYGERLEKNLIQMYRTINPTTYFGKTLAFVIDQSSSVGIEACGWAANFSDYAFIFPNLSFPDGSKCLGYDALTNLNSGLSYPAKSLLHEIIHSYGADHVCSDSTDLMRGSPECEKAGIAQDWNKPFTFDLTSSYYFGGDKSGVDLKALMIWSDGSGQRRPDLTQGICWVGEVCAVNTTTFKDQGVVQLQVKSKSKWLTVDSVKGQLSSCQDCYKYIFRNSNLFTKPGTYQYRIVKLATKKYNAYIGPPKTIKVLN